MSGIDYATAERIAFSESKELDSGSKVVYLGGNYFFACRGGGTATARNFIFVDNEGVSHIIRHSCADGTTHDNYLNVGKALSLAAEAHAGQVDKAGAPYLLHPVRVALHCNGPREQIVALLHDVIEDTAIALSDLWEMFDIDVIVALQSITRQQGEDYMDFIKRVGQNSLATAVKIRDLEDNMDVSRLGGRMHWKLDTYREALDYLKSISLRP